MLRRFILYTLLAVPLAAAGYGLWIWGRIAREFDDRAWDVPAKVFAAPLDLYVGRKLSADELVLELRRLGYGPVSGPIGRGFFRRNGNTIDVGRRAFTAAGVTTPAQALHLEFRNAQIAKLADGAGNAVPIAELEPLLIGNVFPTHAEDRIILTPQDVPELLPRALVAVEDRRFDTHRGIDARALVRAALANLKAGGISQGGSTLTMQLVRSYFLSNRQTYTRKLREAAMALVLELRHDKDEIMLAYLNEIYLGQDGARAIHGFGLASQFYFGKPLAELDVHEIALLVTIVRGPSYYDPRRNPQRALARRTLVLELMRDAGLIDAAAFEKANARDLGVVATKGRNTAYYASFMDLVRRQLASEYNDDELAARGLEIHTTLAPAIQAAAQDALAEEVARLQGKRAELDGAVIVTSSHDGAVLALVGGKRLDGGFNRALDARRQIGSLVKPAVYLAALESGRFSLAVHLDDTPVTLDLGEGNTWSPRNFDETAHGQVTAARALAESLNLATVNLGMQIGLADVGRTLERLGAPRQRERYPSMLLGAIELTPLEAARVYNTLANGGFRAPLTAVRSVVDGRGRTLERYGLTIEQAADPRAVYALNQGLVQVMQRGTGAPARRLLPANLTTAGKTGTSDGLRDSWFAGFSNDHLALVWVGNDSNASTGLTGGTGAAQIWARVVSGLQTSAYDRPPPEGVQNLWVDYQTGLATDQRCADAVYLAIPSRELPPTALSCGSTRTRVGSRIREWLRNRLD